MKIGYIVLCLLTCQVILLFAIMQFLDFAKAGKNNGQP